MNKLKLEDLAVTSFVTQEEFDDMGTVHAHDFEEESRPSQDYYCSHTMPVQACQDTACGGCLTFGYTCDRPSCLYNCVSRYPCLTTGGGGTTTTVATSVNCGADETIAYTSVHPCGNLW